MPQVRAWAFCGACHEWLRCEDISAHIESSSHLVCTRRWPTWLESMSQSKTYSFLQRYGALFINELRPIAEDSADVWLALPSELRSMIVCEDVLSASQVSDLAAHFFLLPGFPDPVPLPKSPLQYLEQLTRWLDLMDLSLRSLHRACLHMVRKKRGAGLSMKEVFRKAELLFDTHGVLLVSVDQCWCCSCDSFFMEPKRCGASSRLFAHGSLHLLSVDYF